MMRRDAFIRLCTVLLVLNLAFIWGNSLLPAHVSKALSDWTLDIFDSVPTEEITETSSKLIRKLAHFTEFASLGFLLAWKKGLQQKNIRQALPVGIAAACMDEAIQMIVPERGPGILDVVIDTCGVLTGILLLKTAYGLIKKQQKYGG